MEGYANVEPFLVITIILSAYLLVRTAYVCVHTPRLTSSEYVSSSYVDILIPVRNEIARGLEKNLIALAIQSHSALRLIVTDDRSTDGSTEAIEKLCQVYPGRVHCVNGLETPVGWMGKTFALSQAKSVGDAEWLALVDADILAEKDLVKFALCYAEKFGLDAVSVLPAFEYRSFWVGVVLPVMVWLSAMRVSPTQTNRKSSKQAFGLGNFILVRRSAHDNIGGFEAYRAAVLDDCEVMQRLKKAGHHVAVIGGENLLSSSMYSNLPELFMGFAKNSFAALRYSWFKLIVFLLCYWLLIVYTPLLFLRGNILAGISIGLFIITMIIAGVRLRAPLQHYILFPVGHVISIGVIVFSAVFTGFGLGVSWKGRIVR